MKSSNQRINKKEEKYLECSSSREKQQEAKRRRHEEYTKNPKLCKHCGKALPWEKKYNNFCSQSCSCSYNNEHRNPMKIVCKQCGKEFFSKSGNKQFCEECCMKKKSGNGAPARRIQANIPKVRKSKNKTVFKTVCKCCGKISYSSYPKIYCSLKCHHQYTWLEKVKIIEARGEFTSVQNGATKGETHRQEVKRYLTEKHGYRCSICGLSEWMGQPIPLVVDHIDGNPTNHKIDNFRLVCGNCDMQLPTYKSKNKGNGRKYRRTKQDEKKNALNINSYHN